MKREQNIPEFISYLERRLTNPSLESLQMSMNNVHAKGLFSLVIQGIEPGELTRAFISERKLKPFQVQLHTHRYPIKLTVIKGLVTQHTAKKIENPDKSMGVNMSEFTYKSFLNGGDGLNYKGDTRVFIQDFTIPIGGSIYMSEDGFHTISCSKGAIWIVEEMGFMVDESRVLGIPFITDGMYTKPEMFQINDKCQLLLKELKSIINSYDSI